jgi:hypothetical protein
MHVRSPRSSLASSTFSYLLSSRDSSKKLGNSCICFTMTVKMLPTQLKRSSLAFQRVSSCQGPYVQGHKNWSTMLSHAPDCLKSYATAGLKSTSTTICWTSTRGWRGSWTWWASYRIGFWACISFFVCLFSLHVLKTATAGLNLQAITLMD